MGLSYFLTRWLLELLRSSFSRTAQNMSKQRRVRSARLPAVAAARFTPLRALQRSTGASAGSRTRINGFGGHYTIHCATLAGEAPNSSMGLPVRKEKLRNAVTASFIV